MTDEDPDVKLLQFLLQRFNLSLEDVNGLREDMKKSENLLSLKIFKKPWNQL